MKLVYVGALVAGCVAGYGQAGSAAIDLDKFGFPPLSKPWTPDCLLPYRGYQWVQWLDDRRIVVAFHTSQVCPKVAEEAVIPGNARVLVLSDAGELRSSIDIPYLADLWQSETPHHGLSISPEGAILFVVMKSPDGDGKLRVLSQDLDSIQEISIETRSKETRAKHYEGVAPDHSGVVLSEDSEQGAPRRCLLYTGLPLQPTGECDANTLKRQRADFDMEAPYPLSGDYNPTAFLGRSLDQRVSTVFFVKDRPLCDLAGILCPGKGKLIVYEKQTKKVVFERSFRLDGALALSPNGRRIAYFRHNKVEIIDMKK